MKKLMVSFLLCLVATSVSADEIPKIFFSSGSGASYFAGSAKSARERSQQQAYDEVFGKAERICGPYSIRVLDLLCESTMLALPVSESVPALYEKQCHLRYACE